MLVFTTQSAFVSVPSPVPCGNSSQFRCFFQRQRPLTILVTCRCVTSRSSARGRMHTWFCWWFCWNSCKYWENLILIPLMEEILHQLVGSLSQYSHGFIHPRWLCRISEPSTASRTSGSVSWPPYTRSLSEIEAQTLDLEELFGQPKRQRGPA